MTWEAKVPIPCGRPPCLYCYVWIENGVAESREESLARIAKDLLGTVPKKLDGVERAVRALHTLVTVHRLVVDAPEGHYERIFKEIRERQNCRTVIKPRQLTCDEIFDLKTEGRPVKKKSRSRVKVKEAKEDE